MQVSVESLSAPLKRKLTVSLPSAQVAQSVNSRLREFAKTADLKGFRRGKVPQQVIEQRYGKQIRAEVQEEAIRSSLGPAIEQEKLRPATTPSITSIDAGAEKFEYVAEFEVMPELGSLELDGMEIEREVAAVVDTDLDRMIETLRIQRRTWHDVSRGAQKDDLVNFEFSAQVNERRIPEQGIERAATIIGSNATLPGLEDGLIGALADDHRNCDINFPADYRDTALAGQSGRAELHVLKVQEPKLPDVDETFVKSFGVTDGTDEAFRREIRANLERELKASLSARLRAQISDKLVERFADFELPDGLIDQDARNLREQAVQNARRQGATVNDEPDLAPFVEHAKRRVRAGMVLSELASKHSMKLDGRRVSEAIAAIASTYEDPSSVVEMYRKDSKLMEGLRGRVMEEQVADWIAEHAQAREVTRSFSEVIRPG